MTQMRFECRGYKPLLMNRIDLRFWKREKEKDRRIEVARTDQKSLEAKIYKDEHGAIGIPAALLLDCLRVAGKSLKTCGRLISTSDESLLQNKRIFEIVDEFLPFPSDTKWKQHHQYLGKTPEGKRVETYVPRFDKWPFIVTVRFAETVIDRDTVYQLFSDGGQMCGLGAFRPASSGPMVGTFGLFKVEHFEVLPSGTDDTAQRSSTSIT